MGRLNAVRTWTGAARQSTANFNDGENVELDVPGSGRGILGELAAQVAEEAALPAQRGKRELRRRHNDLEATRPVVLCDLRTAGTGSSSLGTSPADARPRDAGR